MNVRVQFYSYFRDLTGCESAVESVEDGCTLGALHQRVMARFPALKKMEHATLLAVGVEYQPKDYILQPDEEISLFPPVQGG